MILIMLLQRPRTSAVVTHGAEEPARIILLWEMMEY